MQYQPAAGDGDLFQHHLGQRFLEVVGLEPVDRNPVQIAAGELLGQLARQGPVAIGHLLELQLPDLRVHQIKLALAGIVVQRRV